MTFQRIQHSAATALAAVVGLLPAAARAQSTSTFAVDFRAVALMGGWFSPR